MEIVKKKINFELAKSRSFINFPSVEDYLDNLNNPDSPYKTSVGITAISITGDVDSVYGNMPLDIIIDSSYKLYNGKYVDENLRKYICITTSDAGYALRYRFAKDLYNFILKFINESEYYRVAKKIDKYEFYEIEDFNPLIETGYTYEYYEELPDINEYTEEFTDVCDNNVILCINANKDDFIKRIGNLENAKLYYNLYNDIKENYKKYKYSIPYISSDILLTNDYTDIGIYSGIDEVWSGRRYYENEQAFYNGNLYILKNNLNTDENGNLYYDGYIKNNVIYFDETNESGGYKHWEKAYSTSESPTKAVTYTAITESKLASFVRTKKMVDDDYNEYNFCYNLNGQNLTTELPYLLGYANLRKVGDLYYSDCLDKITINDIEYNKEDVEDGIIEIDDTLSGCTSITFDYTISVLVQYDKEKDEIKKVSGTGVKYHDIYNCSFTQTSLTLDELTFYNVKYIDINYNNDNYDISMIEDYDENAIFSEITVEKEQIIEDITQSANYIKQEKLLGTQDYFIDADINIDRGSADAFERHNILSEVNTFDDLENYRNNIFNL